MDINFNWIFELKHNLTAKGVLATFSFCISIVFFIFSLFGGTKTFDENLRVKIAAAFLIASIAYLSDSGFAYSIAIFIIATMVTKLDFIENIAGIMRNSDAWRKYKQAQMGVATHDEKVKVNKENETEDLKKEAQTVINEQLEKEKKTPKETTVLDGEQTEINRKQVKTFNGFTFEKEALDKLDTLDLFGEFKINRSIKLQIGNDVKSVYDAFVRKEATDFIIEVKLVKTTTGIRLVLLQVRDFINELYQFNLANNRHANIKGIIIVPNNNNTNNIQENIAFLKYDIDRKEFINIDGIRTWINQ